MSHSITSKLYEAALEIPVFHIEDVFVTGILAQSIGVRPEENVGFSPIKRRAIPCLYAQIISSHHLSMNEMKDMYKNVKKKRVKCAPLTKKFQQTHGPGQWLLASRM